MTDRTHGTPAMIRLAALAAALPLMLMAAPVQAQSGTVDEYWARLQALCGQAFEGTLLQAPAGDTSFEGQRLVMHVRSCEENRIRIPFVVGDDLSRTWVLTRDGDRIELRHDHRHQDGSEDEVTQYGGFTPNPGSSHTQIFPADQQTFDTIPNAFPNVWLMSVEPGERFTYAVWRLGTERAYRVSFDLSRSVEAPPAPWGWQD